MVTPNEPPETKFVPMMVTGVPPTVGPVAGLMLVNEGASSIRVVPMFLGVGRHAREDLPLLMTELRALYPKVVFELQQSIGEDQRLIDLIADIAMSP